MPGRRCFRAKVAFVLFAILGCATSRSASRDDSIVRQQLEARYAENAAAMMRGDLAAVMRLRAPDFHVITPDGLRHDYSTMERRTQGFMNGVRAWNGLTFTIDTLRVSGDTAYAIVTQHADRMALRPDNKVHHVETWATQRETWVRSADQWVMWRVDQIGNQRRVIDGDESKTPSDATVCESPLAGVRTSCEWLDVDGQYRVRSIITRPEGTASARLPAVLFVQWLSCDPVTIVSGVSDGWTDMLRALIQRSGMIVARTEKPGLSGGGGPACADLGYDEELRVHRAALQNLRTLPEVHADSLFVFGASMGGTMAPLLAANSPVRGVIVAGTTGVTWREHMIALDERVMRLRGVPSATAQADMADHTRFHALYLGEQRTPREIVQAWPAARVVWHRMIGTDSALSHHYGRPVLFHHEAQRQNWPAAWGRLASPVLVISGGFDWIMPPPEHDAIMHALSLAVRQRARLVRFPRMGHDFRVFASAEDAFRGRDGRFDTAVADTILSWLTAWRRAPQ